MQLTSSWTYFARIRLDRLIERRDEAYDDALSSGSSLRAFEQVDELITRVDEAITPKASASLKEKFTRWWTGSDVENAWRAIHEGEALLLEHADEIEFRARLPRTYRYVTEHLPSYDQEVEALRNVLRSECPGEIVAFGRHSCSDPGNQRRDPVQLDDSERLSIARKFVAMLYRRALRVSDDEGTKVREYRNFLIKGVAATSFLAVLTAALCVIFPALVPDDLQFGSMGERWRVPAIMGCGVIGATLAILYKLPSIPSYDLPYTLDFPQLFLKIPVGALTGLIGVLILLSDLPFLDPPQSQLDVVLAAIIFGFAQQLATRFIDREAGDIVEATQSVTPTSSGSAGGVVRGPGPRSA